MITKSTVAINIFRNCCNNYRFRYGHSPMKDIEVNMCLRNSRILNALHQTLTRATIKSNYFSQYSASNFSSQSIVLSSSDIQSILCGVIWLVAAADVKVWRHMLLKLYLVCVLENLFNLSRLILFQCKPSKVRSWLYMNDVICS
jgi:hypothetical protein